MFDYIWVVIARRSTADGRRRVYNITIGSTSQCARRRNRNCRRLMAVWMTRSRGSDVQRYYNKSTSNMDENFVTYIMGDVVVIVGQ